MINLEDPKTNPNPEIKELLDVGHRLFALTMGDEGLLYAEANKLVNQAVEKLFEIKNAIATRQGQR